MIEWCLWILCLIGVSLEVGGIYYSAMTTNFTLPRNIRIRLINTGHLTIGFVMYLIGLALIVGSFNSLGVGYATGVWRWTWFFSH